MSSERIQSRFAGKFSGLSEVPLSNYTGKACVRLIRIHKFIIPEVPGVHFTISGYRNVRILSEEGRVA